MRTLLLSICLMISVAGANELTSLLEKVQTEPAEMEFELEIFWSIREKTESKDGKLLIRGDEEFDFTLDNSRWISDGVTVWQHSEENNQLVIKNFFDLGMSLRPATMFDRFSNRNFEQVSVEGESIWRWVGSDDPDYTRIDVLLSDNGDVFEWILFVDADDNESRYEFDSMNFLDSVDDSQFVFTVPEGVEVFDER